MLYEPLESWYALYYDPQDGEQPDECSMNIDFFNSVFGTNYTSIEEYVGGSEIVICHCLYGQDEVLSQFALKVKKLHLESTPLRVYNQDIATQATINNFFTYELYFDEPTSASAIYNLGEDKDFYVATEYYKTINSITKIVLIFKDIFSLIATALCAIMILLMASYSFGNIRSRSYEIGVMKAMGARTRNVAGIFLVQVIAMGFIICLLFGIIFYFGMPTANKLLMDSIVEYVDNASITSITLLSFDKDVMWIGIGIIAGVTLVSALAPFVGVMAIKPVNIIKSKE